MQEFFVQLTDGSLSPDWWRRLIAHFVRPGDAFEIRCWKEEDGDIARASSYGEVRQEQEQVSVHGRVSPALLRELLLEAPADKTPYHSMTSYFALRIEGDRCTLSSEHYGTELYLRLSAYKDVCFFQQTMAQYPGSFSIRTAP